VLYNSKNIYIYLFFTFTSFLTFRADASFNSCVVESNFVTSELDNQTMEIIGDSSYYDANKNIIVKGNTLAKTNNFNLSANNLIYSKIDNKVIASGNVQFENLDSRISSKNISLTNNYSLNSKFFNAKDADFLFYSSGLRGRAKEILESNSTKTLSDVLITTCPENSNVWSFNAKKIELMPNNLAKAKNVIVDLYDFPVLYLPYIEWSTKGRKSGFLSPKFNKYNDNTGDDSYLVSIPYYINISPDKDLLLNAKYFSNRGTLIGSKFRKLISNKNKFIDNGDLDIEIDYLDSDKVLLKDRWSLNSKIDVLSSDSNLSAKINRVSDKNYLRDINLEGTSEDRLLSYLSFSKKLDDYKFNLYTENEQVVNQGVDDYTKNIQLSLSKLIKNKDNFLFDVYGEYTDFDNKLASKIDTKRTHVDLEFKKDFNINNTDITPSLDFYSTSYDTNSTSSTRRLLSFDVDISKNLEREINVDSISFIQDLIPRMKYIYTQKKEQTLIENFDTELLPETYQTLFAKNKFTGIDKISNQHSLIMGLESNFYNSLTGDSIISIKSGQKYRFSDTEMNLSGAQENVRSYSDIFNSISFSNKDVNYIYDFNINPEDSKINKSVFLVNLETDSKNIMNLMYIDDEQESIDFKLSAPFLINTKVNVGLNRSLTDSRNNKIYTDLEYDSCCWSSRVSYSKNYTGNNNFDNQISFDLVFKGLTSKN